MSGTCKRVAVILGLALPLGLLAGCAEKLTYERFGWLEKGTSSKVDVEATLGTPNHKLPDQWVWQRQNGLTVRTQFAPDGTLISKQWLDPMHNQTDVDDMGPADPNEVESQTRVRTIREP